MSNFLPIMLGITVIILLVGVIVTIVMWKKRKEGKPQETNYQAFYAMGIIFLPVGIVMMIVLGNPGMLGLTVLGIVYMAIGLGNKDKWKSHKRSKNSKKK